MTTIAFDKNGTLAADSLYTDGYRIAGYKNKILRVKGGVLASTGIECCAALAEKWFNDGRPENKKPTLIEFTGIFCPDDGSTPTEFRERLVSMPIFIPHAIGSGYRWALSAMQLGKTAAEAIEFAIENDIYTGGEVTTWTAPGKTEDPQHD